MESRANLWWTYRGLSSSELIMSRICISGGSWWLTCLRISSRSISRVSAFQIRTWERNGSYIFPCLMMCIDLEEDHTSGTIFTTMILWNSIFTVPATNSIKAKWLQNGAFLCMQIALAYPGEFNVDIHFGKVQDLIAWTRRFWTNSMRRLPELRQV